MNGQWRKPGVKFGGRKNFAVPQIQKFVTVSWN